MDFKTAEQSQITLSELMLPSHSNFSGKIHGGHILNLMDQVVFACSSKHSGHYCVTASVNRVDFLHPVEVGEILTLRASINFTGRTSMVVGVRVDSENIQTGKSNHCNSSYFTMVAKDSSGENVAVPGLLLNDKEDVRRYVRSIYRQEQRKNRDSNFQPESFVVREHLAELDQHNVQVTDELV
jgi:acyl-CoA hydrolase|tara:strand:- start:240 stop:788 length:549 start_codon:yes stop_codon:yes gene_type:complete